MWTAPRAGQLVLSQSGPCWGKNGARELFLSSKCRSAILNINRHLDRLGANGGKIAEKGEAKEVDLNHCCLHLHLPRELRHMHAMHIVKLCKRTPRIGSMQTSAKDRHVEF